MNDDTLVALWAQVREAVLRFVLDVGQAMKLHRVLDWLTTRTPPR